MPMSLATIGSILTVYATIVPEYDMDGYRNLTRCVDGLPKKAYYVGYTFKQYGKYDPGDKPIRLVYDEPPDYNPPKLYIQGVVRVFRIRFHERGKEHYCLPRDATPRLFYPERRNK